MIKLKKPKTEKQKTSFFLYKSIDPEYNIDIKSMWSIKYTKFDGEYRFYKPLYGDLDRILTIPEHLQTLPFTENLLFFLMFKINSIRFEVHNTYIPLVSYDLDLNYYLLFFPTADSGVLNPFTVINNPKSLIVTTKQPYAFQEIVFPKTYVKGLNMQGFGTWNSCDYNFVHHIPACIQIANQYIDLLRDFDVATLTLTTNVSFRGRR